MGKYIENSQKEQMSFLERLHIEHDDLIEKIEKCANFIESENFRDIIKEDYPAFLLCLQRNVMETYGAILEQRIAIVNGEKEITTLPRMNFGLAIQALKFGFSIHRNSWKKDVNVYYDGKWNLRKVPGFNPEPWTPTINDIYADDWEIFVNK